MRKKLIVAAFAILLAPAFVQAQWIQSLTVLPANPTTNDTITILAECQFSFGSCDQHTSYYNVVGNDIYAGALHCTGVLTVICNYTDTIKIPPLPAGNYTFHFQLDAGQGPIPCTPGIVQGPNDSVTFTVTLTTSLDEYISNDEVKAIPNPSDGSIHLDGLGTGSFPVRTEVFSSDGKLVMEQWVRNASQEVNITHLAAGMYQLRLYTKDDKRYLIQVVKQ